LQLDPKSDISHVSLVDPNSPRTQPVFLSSRGRKIAREIARERWQYGSFIECISILQCTKAYLSLVKLTFYKLVKASFLVPISPPNYQHSLNTLISSLYLYYKSPIRLYTVSFARTSPSTMGIVEIRNIPSVFASVRHACSCIETSASPTATSE
jgi:hypothetical protein